MLRIFLVTLFTLSSHAAEPSREVTVYAPFERESPHSVMGLYHSRPVTIDLRPYGPSAGKICGWLLRAPGANVVHRSFVAGLLTGHHLTSQTIVLQLEHDEMLGLSVGRDRPDRWFFQSDPVLQAALPDLQSWNDLFGATGPLDPYLPGFFRAVLDVQDGDPRREDIVFAIDHLRGRTFRNSNSLNSQMVEAVGKFAPSGFHLTAITMNLRIEARRDDNEYVIPAYALVSGHIAKDAAGFAIVEPFGTRFELSVFRANGLAGPKQVDLEPFVGRRALVQGHLDRGDHRERISVVEGLGLPSFIKID